MKKKLLFIIILFIMNQKNNFCSNATQQVYPNIAGIKTPYIYMPNEKLDIERLNAQIKGVFSELSKYQEYSSSESARSVFFPVGVQTDKTKKVTGGKSLYQLRKESKEKNSSVLSSAPISVMNQVAPIVSGPAQSMQNEFSDDLSEASQTMTIGERIIYYKQKYLKLAKKYLEAIIEIQKNNKELKI